MASTSISKTSFYSSKGKGLTWKARLERKEKQFKQNALPTEYHTTLDGPPIDWKCFYRQEEAFQFARKRGSGLNVFSYESTCFEAGKGQRLYLVASYDQFWHYYKQLSMDKRHHYEVIPQGVVCNLYFDLEFIKEFNQGKNGETMTRTLINYISFCLMKHYNVKCTSETVLQMDASTKEKFSQHLVFHLPDAVFKDNINAGNFVKHFLNQLVKLVEVTQTEKTSEEVQCKKAKLEADSDVISLTLDDLDNAGLSVEQLAYLIVKDKNGKETLFCDTGVYTKNRNFRLYLSCKLGKKNPLLLSEQNTYQVNPLSEDKEKQFFMDSLITNIEYNTKMKILGFEDDTILKHKNKEALSGYHHSPYPEVDNFVHMQVSKNGRGHIRRWSYFPQTELIVYDIAGNRWCENIGREHKSNNIMLLVELKAGVLYQKCHDPDCRASDFKSRDVVLPTSVLLHHQLDNDDDDDDLSDSELVQAAQCVESQLQPCCNDRQQSGSLDSDMDDEELLQAVQDVESSFTYE